jgi:FkbM family methyltransferase
MLSTRRKITLARWAYQCVHAARALFARDDHTIVVRGDIVWDLDLGEGIDFAIYLLGAFERSSIRAYSQLIHPGAVVIDVGANIGAHTLPFAHLVGPGGRVLAFEPTTYAFHRLQRNLALNPAIAQRVSAYQAMLAAQSGDVPGVDLYARWPLRHAPETRHSTHMGIAASTDGAEVVALDDWIERHNISRVDFIKLDVDGHECRVLRGAVETLRKFRPSLLVEFMPYGLEEAGASLADLVKILTDLHYTFFRVPDLTALPNTTPLLQDIIPDGGSLNVLCRPEARPAAGIP